VPTALAPADLALAGAVSQHPASRGRHARHDRPRAGEPDTLVDEGLTPDAMLAQLAAETRSPVGSIGARFSSSAAKAGLMVGGVVAFTALLFVLMALFGSLL
jgi:hypothetical protein